MQDESRQLTLERDEVELGLKALRPDVPWAHHFKFGDLETISASMDQQFYTKAMALGRLGELAVALMRYHTKSGSIENLRVLDIASAEGAHSILFARAGAREVVGVEGRELYLERARFAAKALGQSNVRFELGDVRKIDADRVGTFDFIFCSGILHHLGKDDFLPMLQNLYRLTTDTLMLYTHVSSAVATARIRLQPTEPVAGKYEGRLFQEHPEEATAEERTQKVRASLDNTYSFWATPESLMDALKDVGFSMINVVQQPHIFPESDDRSYRPIIVARK